MVSEQFPRGGALTLNAIAGVGVGMISVGVLGNPLLGSIQDHYLDKTLATQNSALHAQIAGPPQSKFGLTYQPLDKTKIAALPAAAQTEVETIRTANNQSTLAKVAVLPALMFLCYLALIVYFRSTHSSGLHLNAGRSDRRRCRRLNKKSSLETNTWRRRKGFSRTRQRGNCG